jgi:formamidopyrimidine-DNA glycosylase
MPMPELPEVQTVVNDLDKKIIGAVIVDFWTGWPKAVKLELKQFVRRIKGQRIIQVFRRAKNIIVELSNHQYLVIHLRMTGQLLIDNEPTDKAPYFHTSTNKHLHHCWTLKLKNKPMYLQFRDVRKFATINLLDSLDALKNSGQEPLSPEFTAKVLQHILHRKAGSNIKTILLDQNLISGIGNIYASEILFAAKINPHKKGGELSPVQSGKLHAAIKKILIKAIKFRGTTFSDYRDSAGRIGAFQNELKVYNRKGQKCRAAKCQGIIQKTVIAQRSTFWCPECQK